MHQTVIRASSLPHYTDCTRRSAARMFAKELAGYGYVLNPQRTSIGAAVGTATHNSLESGIILKNEGKDYVSAMKDVAAQSITTSITDGVIWDDTTRNKDAAITQAVRQARAVMDFMPQMQTIEIERKFEANLGDGFILSGHIDIRGVVECFIWDVKTGTVQRANQAQYGAYSLLCRSNDINVMGLGEIYVKRVGVSKPQPDPVIVPYDVATSEQIAHQFAQKIKIDITLFRKSGGDLWVWLPNPNSMMCSPDYCPAWGTNFCNSHKNR